MWRLAHSAESSGPNSPEACQPGIIDSVAPSGAGADQLAPDDRIRGACASKPAIDRRRSIASEQLG